MKTYDLTAPEGFHWMQYEDGPVLMVGEYQPHEGAVESIAVEVIEEHDPERLPVSKGAEWDKIYNAILERTNNKELAAATATARTGSRFNKNDDPKTPAKPSERRTGSKGNPEGSAGGQRGGIKLSEANIKALETKRDEHNEKWATQKASGQTLAHLKPCSGAARVLFLQATGQACEAAINGQWPASMRF